MSAPRPVLPIQHLKVKPSNKVMNVDDTPLGKSKTSVMKSSTNILDSAAGQVGILDDLLDVEDDN